MEQPVLPNGFNFSRTVERFYRGSLAMLGDLAVPYWNAEKVSFIAQLGDLLDGQCAKQDGPGGAESARSLAKVMSQLEKVSCGLDNVYHCIGNHELYNFSRDTLRRELGLDQKKARAALGVSQYGNAGAKLGNVIHVALPANAQPGMMMSM